MSIPFSGTKFPNNVKEIAPIHVSTNVGDLGLSEYIMQKTNYKNSKTIFGMTSLHTAAMFGYSDLCQLIMQKVENKNPYDSSKLTPLHYGASNGHFHVCKVGVLIISEILSDHNI